MSVLIKGGRDHHGGRRLRRRRLRRGRADRADRLLARRRGRQDDRRRGQVRAPGLRRPAHAPGHAVRRHGHDRRRRVRPDRPPRSAGRPATWTSSSSRKGRRSPRRSTTWKAKAAGKQVIDMGYHMAITDLERGRHARGARRARRPGRHVLQALHGLQGRAHGRRRDALQRDGGRGEIAARSIMVHAENGDVIDVLVQPGARGRQHGAALPRADPPARGRGRGDEPRDPARAPRRRAALRRPRHLPRGGRADRPRARGRAGTCGARPARSTSSTRSTTSRSRTSRARSTSTRRPSATRRTGTSSGTPCAPTRSRRSRPTTARSRWDGQKTLGKDDFSKIPNGGPGPREPAADDPRVRRPRRADLR